MKKLFIFVLIFIANIQFCCSKDYSLNFNGAKYHLLYSIKNKDFGGYLNEYYKKGETYNVWTDMIAVHHFPNAYSPIDRIKDFKDYLSSMNIPSSLTFNDNKNAAMIDFIMIKSDKMPIVLEFNIFKYEKSEKCGSVAIQYTKRYSATTTMQVELIKNDFEHNRNKLIKKIKAFEIPQVVTEDIDKCISGAEISKQANESENNIENPITEADVKNEIIEGETDYNQEECISEDCVTETKNDEYSKCETEEMEQMINESAEDSLEIQTEVENITDESTAENDVINDKESYKDKFADMGQDNVVNDENFSANEDNEANKSISGNDDLKANSTFETQNEEIRFANKPAKNSEEQIYNTQDKETAESDENIKNTYYLVIHDKDSFYAKPRTKKELKEQIKKHKKELKMKNSTYLIINSKNDYIAKPRSKKEMKEYKKSLKYEKQNSHGNMSAE